MNKIEVVTFGWIIAIIISQTTELIAKIHIFDNSFKGKHLAHLPGCN